ncbi:hypothetical protein F2P44_18145 [Massilia sp. CCM 8695]|uniref:Uncharacterized protein n=1 Tax=Massilia frigida TaxID=2609281 RepID=A0ABX0N6Z8_9BURK|nr:hypothetical protein [Massilia frigida]NHZ81181.1 hypothetical protein [Massilia frigida]
MNDNLYAPPQADMSIGATIGSDNMFYVVSLTKFTILFLATLGMYQFFWYFKNWNLYKRQCKLDNAADSEIWPVPRAIFAVFYTHSLFNEVSMHAAAKMRPTQWDHKSHATGLVVMLIALNVLTRMNETTLGSGLSLALMLILMVGIFFSSFSAQKHINACCGDPAGRSNSRFTAANYVWIAIGCICWISIFGTGFLAGAGVTH